MPAIDPIAHGLSDYPAFTAQQLTEMNRVANKMTEKQMNEALRRSIVTTAAQEAEIIAKLNKETEENMKRVEEQKQQNLESPKFINSEQERRSLWMKLKTLKIM